MQNPREQNTQDSKTQRKTPCVLFSRPGMCVSGLGCGAEVPHLGLAKPRACERGGDLLPSLPALRAPLVPPYPLVSTTDGIALYHHTPSSVPPYSLVSTTDVIALQPRTP
eukprot:858217-Rhodomonas_salina.1